MNYITTKETSEIWEIANRMVVYHGFAKRDKGANKMGNTWLVFARTEKSANGRYMSSKVKDGENK